MIKKESFMKKVISIFVLLFFVVFTGCAQNPTQGDNDYIYLPQKESSNVIKNYKYDKSGNIISKKTYCMEYFLFIPYKHLKITEDTENIYDENGNLVKAITTTVVTPPITKIPSVSKSCSVSGKMFKYDAHGNLTEYGYYDVFKGESTYEPLYYYEYDSNGNMIFVRDSSLGDYTSYTYNENNQLIKEESPANLTTEYFYDDVGKISKTLTTQKISRTVDGKKKDIVSYTIESIYNYDKKGRLTSKISYNYDADGNFKDKSTRTYSDFVKIAKNS